VHGDRAHDCCVVIGDGLPPLSDDVVPPDEVVPADDFVPLDDVVPLDEVAAVDDVVVPIDPVQAITPQAITNAASAPATIRRRIVLMRRARSARSRRAVSRFSEGVMP
jgi:hypothetical protein